MKTVNKIPDEWQNTSELFLALGDSHRQRLLLAFEKGERLNIGQLVAASTLSRTAIAHHLKTLHRAGVLKSEKVGKEVFFWINKVAVEEALKRVLHYIENET